MLRYITIIPKKGLLIGINLQGEYSITLSVMTHS